MSSLPSSSSSSDTPAELINKILNTKANKPDFDLSVFVVQIDLLLLHYEAQLGKKNLIREQLGDLPSGASNFVDQVSTNVTRIAEEIQKYSGNKHETSIKVLNAIGSVHWVAVGFLVVGAALKIANTIKYNVEACLRLFKSMSDLSKIILQLHELPDVQKKLHDRLNKSIEMIVEGAISCCSQKKRKGIKRVWKASTDRQELQQLSRDMDDMRNMLHLQISVSTLKVTQMIDDKLTSLVRPPPLVSIPKHDAVGIEEKIEEVIQWLDWESNSATRAVVVYGIGGSGKTTLANAVYSSLVGKLQGWKCSKITLIRNLEKYPKVEDLQSLILEDLTGTKHDVRDFQTGQQILKEIIGKGPIFIYIDNVLYIEPLKNLLPMDVSSAEKLRLLITARDKNVSGVIECCGTETCELYDIGSLSIDAALKVLCKNIDRNREMESILQERPQVRQIAEKCRCCPLFLELIGCYLHQRKNEVKHNEVEPYEQVLHSLEEGDFFSGSKMYNFDEQRVLFTYDGLNPSAKEAFLDICSFFFSWKWEKVAWIVGWEEMLCLEGGALIKREGKKIKIHDLILTAGRNKSKDNRFNDAKAFSMALKNKERVSQIKGIWIKSMESPLLISAEELDAMSRSLRVLCMGNEAAKLITIKGKCGEQFDELRFLDVESEMCNLPVNMFNLNQLRYLSIRNPKKDVILSRSMNLPNLNVLKFSKGRIHGIAEIACLCSLKQLSLARCEADWISQCFTNSHHLQRLKLYRCQDLTELPESLVRLPFLQKLDLSSCINLKQLPAGFGELTTLTQLDLSHCSSLQELPRDLEKLTSLQSLNIVYCSSLTCLPHNLGGLMSALGSDAYFDGCSSLSELPEDIFRSISLGYCTKLERLPSRFGELTYLQRLCLSGCESLQELCNDFHCLGGLTELELDNCKSLSSLPLGFGELSSLVTLKLKNCKSLSSLPPGFGNLFLLETLNLSGCDKLEELCNDFHCLVALKYLDLSECNSLCNLPDRFGDFGCLESLDLSGCPKLVKLSDDFHLLRSLIRLDLSKCGSLAGEWMDKVGNIKSLWRLDIVGSERMIERWMETKSQKERNLAVVTAVPQGRKGEGALLLEGVLSKVFDEEGLLVDADERPFHSSSLQPQTLLIFIIDKKYSWEWEALGKNLQQLQSISKELQIIYFGSHFKSLSSKLAKPILAYTPDNSSFYHKLSTLFHISDIAVFRSTDELEEKSLKCLSAWEDISSYMCNRVTFLTKTPLESNIELLNELLVTKETDYLLLSKNRQVKVAVLQGKLILLLFTNLMETLEVRTSAVKEMYLKMQDSHNYVAELVWVPLISWEITWEEFERVTANAPWPVVNPWLIGTERMRTSILGREQKLPCVCVVDEKGRISKEDALPMIERWGLEAYPFSQDREEELAKAEWEAFKFDSLSNLQFVFPNLEFSNKAKEMMDRGVMMLKLAPHLNCALTMLKMDFLVFYDARRDICAKENEDDVPCTKAFSFYDMYKFWLRVRSLLKDLNGMGRNERIVKLRRMVLGLASKQRESWYRPKGELEMRVVLVDGNGEMTSRRGMEVVELPCGDEKDSKEKLVEDIKTGDVEKSEESMWIDGIIHPKHYRSHLLLKLRNSDNGISCSLCGEERNTVYQCTEREKYVICEEC